MERIKIPETYEEFLKTPKKDLYELSKMDIPLEVASRIMKFICKAEDEYRKKPKLIDESKRKRKLKQSGKICMNKFDQVYQSIISEAKFEDKKWIEKETIN